MSQPTDARGMWEYRYAGDAYLYGTHPNDFLRETVADLSTGSALCLADGEGRNSVFLAELGHDVTAVDLSEAGIAKGQALATNHQVVVEGVVADLTEFDLGSDRWDLIVSIFAHTPPPVRKSLHNRIATALRPGGVFVLEAYTPSQIGRGTGGPPVPEMTMTAAELERDLLGLDLTHVEELVRPVVEGPGHTGDGALVQVVGRRPTTGSPRPAAPIGRIRGLQVWGRSHVLPAHDARERSRMCESFDMGPEPHPELDSLSWILGSWVGTGTGDYPTIEPFDYVEESTYSHVGKPFIAYAQKTRDASSGQPLHSESGYLRPAGDNRVELVVSQPTGIVEVHGGIVDGTSLVLKSTLVLTTPTAKTVRSVIRRLTLAAGNLDYEVDMEAVGEPMLPHLRARLRPLE